MEEFETVLGELIDRGLVFQLLNSRNITLIGISLSLSVTSGFILLHLIIDKLLFKKFYEEPNLLAALRRGIFFSAGGVSILIFRIFQADDSLSILTIGLLVVVEIALTKFFSSLKFNKAELENQKVESPEFKVVSKGDGVVAKKNRFNIRDILKRLPRKNKVLQEPHSPDIIGNEETDS
jgi:hypothetical protein